ncbi:hypothetical protein [Pseudooctadecabacter sp.]|uniref:hypothetical protein n=1 Tax=Pseudooctadecabacter sp. TaxID=1966338 RepID=UPI0025D69E87|nr:hypothetical protein [Pseudooctadecabacter sp.]
MGPSEIGNLFLSASALAGLMIVSHVISARDAWAPLNRRFIFGLRVMMLLFAGRALFILTDVQFFRFFILLGASLIPISVLILTEGLLRRHAPPMAKLWVAGGTAVFAVLSLWWRDSIDPARLAGLMVFQLSGFAIGGWMVLRRDRASLTAAENRSVERIALSLVLLVPLAAADFLLVFLGFPAQTSPLGVLFLCWLAVSLGRTHTGHRTPVVSFMAIVVAAALSGTVIAFMVPLTTDETVLTLAVVLASLMVAVLVVEAQSLRTEEQSQSLLRHLAEDRSRDGMGFLRGLQSHPLVEGAVLVSAGDLAGLDGPVLRHVFAVRPVLKRADPPFTDGTEGDHIAHLFGLFDATHILLADDDPLTLVAVSMPALAASPRAELELAAVQRMARLMAIPR